VTLDEAWAEAKAALPEGWHLLLSASPHAGNDAYARDPEDPHPTPWNVTANGSTPADALHALAAKLRGSPESEA
jgi:hypothetical protein